MVKIKSFVSISLFIFFSVVVAVLVAGLVFYDKNSSSAVNSMTGVNTDNSPDNNFLTDKDNSKFQLTAAEVAKHNSTNNCWIIINGKVYNLTSYLSAHPGGASAMSPYCGKDGSTAFATKDKNSPQSHSSTAQGLLANYYIGDFNQTTSQTNIDNTTTIPPSSGGEKDEDEWEDD